MPVSLVRIAGVVLETTGKVLRSGTFDEFLEEKAAELIDAQAEKLTRWAMGDRRKRAKNKIKKDVSKKANTPEINAALNKYVNSIPEWTGKIGDYIDYIRVSEKEAIAIPRFIVDNVCQAILLAEMLDSAELTGIYEAKPVRESFLRAVVRDSVDAMIYKPDQLQKLDTKSQWKLIGGNPNYRWNQTYTGYFIACKTPSRSADFPSKREAKKLVQGMMATLGEIKQDPRDAYVLAWERLIELILSGKSANDCYRALKDAGLNPALKVA